RGTITAGDRRSHRFAQKYSSAEGSRAMRRRSSAMKTRYGWPPKSASAARSNGESAAPSASDSSISRAAAAGSATNRAQKSGSALIAQRQRLSRKARAGGNG